MNLKNLSLLVALAVLSLSAFAQTAREQQIADRLAPVGETCMAGEACAKGQAGGNSGPKDPETVYNTYCTACHSTGASDSPIMGDEAAWAERAAKGTDVLYQNAIDGLNVMPPKGLCMDCSNEDIIATVDYILSKSGQ